MMMWKDENKVETENKIYRYKYKSDWYFNNQKKQIALWIFIIQNIKNMKSQYFVRVLSLVWLIDQTQSYMWGFAPISTTVPPHNETMDSGVEISNGKNMDGNNTILDDETLRLHWLDFQIKRQIGFPSLSDETEPINIPTVLRDAMEQEQAQREQAIPTRDNDIKSIFIYGTKRKYKIVM